jgi:two-component system sensor histidine kinase YesM
MDEDYNPDEINVIKEVILGESNVFVDGYNMAVNVATLANTKWRICVFINDDKVNDIQNNFVVTLILVSVVIAVIGVLLYLFIAQMITSPMKKLELAMLKVEKSDYFRMEEVDLDASKEVKAMMRQFNKMMVKISELMQRVIEEQRAQRKSELKALQNQINPHFLHNTLDSIMWLVENNKNKEAGEMVVALSRLFRASISKDNETISLRDEIEHVRNYLLIQKKRYAGSFEYEFDIGEDVLDCLTLKLILQPMVENSIYHGLKNKIDEGKIKITASLSDSFLTITVADNGYGMRKETIEKLYNSFESGDEGDNVGLKNIYNRLMIYYGGNAEMKIESELDEGTVITIREPVGGS